MPPMQTVIAFLASVALVSAQRESGDRTRVSDLVAVVQIHRHGQRIPVSYYKNDPWSNSSYWPAAMGQLTNTGKKQHWNLGKFTRRRYNGFLSSQFDPSEFYVQTTDVDRTHMSAQSNIAGIFPPRGPQVWNTFVRWQPIPVRVASTSVLATLPSCSLYFTQVANVSASAPEYVKTDEKYQELYAYLTKYSGTNVTSVAGASGIYDTLLIEDQFGFKLPKWTRSVFPEPLRTLDGLHFKAYSYTDYQKKVAAGNWLYEVLDYFSNIWEDSSYSQKYQLYSGHDFNLAAILNTLGAYDGLTPTFASTIYFELRNKSGQAIINTWYRKDGKFNQITIKGCNKDCRLDKAQSLLSPWLVDRDTYDAECAATSAIDMTHFNTNPIVHRIFKEVSAYNNARIKEFSNLKVNKAV